MVNLRFSVPVIAVLSLLLAGACGDRATVAGDGSPAELGPPGPGLSRVILVGDDIAMNHGEALGAALDAAGVEFHSMASEGGGTVVGPLSGDLWATLPDRLRTAKPSTVVYQITGFDWGTEGQQRSAYERLLTTVNGAGAKLVVVTMPPIRPQEPYAGHLGDLARAPRVARQVTEAAGDRAAFLDAAAVWGDTYQRVRDGAADRSSDGIHTCPQGAARFTTWLLGELAKRYPGFTPPAAEKWADTGWSADDHFVGCPAAQ
ncbi:hypothetical protein Asp14428_15380 [Actinoplanes sp. NBRC 14428]|uniref:SGNH/GDSL hydrolase family protein n=1 Tax=Pseudosporangium ferrugineum TaxID=439699 RepID=A0A2T0SAT7_9ACTN|nr:SGNH/GDSL hydrolase family protein [Pseudosporangium ferrugineum]PRY30528.1 hypothetical protein CLV70_10480 [Pseudosporangium ferrugineum]BCJ50063.1 hypothetical protein Asp14428_15380 [Actinoplanes sp. NBRC 14428]